MDYELSKRLVDIAESGKKTNRRFNLARFLSLQSQINTAIEAGWSIKFIWETLHEDKKIDFGYRTFLRMVKERSSSYSPSRRKKTNNDKVESLDSLLKSKNETQANENINHDKFSSIDEPDIKSKSNEPVDHGNPKGFEFNPIVDPKDLLW